MKQYLIPLTALVIGVGMMGGDDLGTRRKEIPPRSVRMLEQAGGGGRVVPNGLDDWHSQATNTMGYWISTNARIVQLPDQKFQPQFWVPEGTVGSDGKTNSGGWTPIYEDNKSFTDLWLAQLALRRSFEIKKELSDTMGKALADVFKSAAEELKPKAEPVKPTNSVISSGLAAGTNVSVRFLGNVIYFDWTTNNPVILGPANAYDNLPYTNSIVFDPPGSVVLNLKFVGTNAQDYVDAAKYFKVMPDLVNLLATSGEVCKVRGHAWKAMPHMTLEVQYGPVEDRQCVVCGNYESRAMPAWPTP